MNLSPLVLGGIVIGQGGFPIDQWAGMAWALNAVRCGDRTAIQRQIAATDVEIDQLVYELYGLTDAEIRIVEEATR